MTPTELEQACRERYNAVGSRFWSQSEIFTLIYNAQMDLCNRTHPLERTYQVDTVADTQEYDLPSTTLAVKRATWNGFKLESINFMDDDLITGYDADTTASGDPRYFWVWNKVISLRPIPSSVQTLKIWVHSMPSTVSSTSTLDVQVEYHLYLMDYVLSAMVAKDDNIQMAKYYRDLWDVNIGLVKNALSRNKTSKAFNYVRDEDTTGLSIIGVI
jgi:hypothetical protein